MTSRTNPLEPAPAPVALCPVFLRALLTKGWLPVEWVANNCVTKVLLIIGVPDWLAEFVDLTGESSRRRDLRA
jgi:hypothetical protein